MMVDWGRRRIQTGQCTDQRSVSAVVFSTGQSAISGAVIGYFLRGMCTPQLAFSLFHSWPVGAVGWRGGSHE